MLSGLIARMIGLTSSLKPDLLGRSSVGDSRPISAQAGARTFYRSNERKKGMKLDSLIPQIEHARCCVS